MKTGELKYYLILGAIFIAYIVYQVFGPKPFDWTPTLKSDDKNPFGTYVLNEILPDIFSTGIDKSYETLYELKDSTFSSLFILTYFSIARLSLLDRGAGFAIAHIRGGGEMGRRWYDEGKMLKKQATFTDFVDCARHLVDAGLTPQRPLTEIHFISRGTILRGGNI